MKEGLWSTEDLKQFRGIAELHQHRGAYIYFLSSFDEIIYVGQATDLNKRIAGHKNEKTKGFDAVHFIELTEIRRTLDIDRIEAALIRAIRPRRNVTHNNKGPTSYDLEIIKTLTVNGDPPIGSFGWEDRNEGRPA